MGLDVSLSFADGIFEPAVGDTEGITDRDLHVVTAFTEARIVVDVDAGAARHLYHPHNADGPTLQRNACRSHVLDLGSSFCDSYRIWASMMSEWSTPSKAIWKGARIGHASLVSEFCS
jgi:hypothetical protein